jgi:hypothetical protein
MIQKWMGGGSVLRQYAATLSAIVFFLNTSSAISSEATRCWRDFFSETGVAEPVGPLTEVPYDNYVLRIPSSYLWRGVPATLNDGLSLLAWSPNFSPSSPEKITEFMQNPRASAIVVSIVSRGGNFSLTRLIESMKMTGRAERNNNEIDVFGFQVFRSPFTQGNLQAEIHLPNDSQHFFYCAADGSVPNPMCVSNRAIGFLHLRMTFQKADLHHYVRFDTLLSRMMCCAVDQNHLPVRTLLQNCSA